MSIAVRALSRNSFGTNAGVTTFAGAGGGGESSISILMGVVLTTGARFVSVMGTGFAWFVSVIGAGFVRRFVSVIGSGFVWFVSVTGSGFVRGFVSVIGAGFGTLGSRFVSARGAADS